MQNIVDYIAAKLSITSERGVTAIEYGLIAALVAVAIVGVVTLVGSKLTNTFNTVANSLK
jgi:pilus assembly protein Flp/PilA